MWAIFWYLNHGYRSNELLEKVSGNRWCLIFDDLLYYIANRRGNSLDYVMFEIVAESSDGVNLEYISRAISRAATKFSVEQIVLQTVCIKLAIR